MQYWSFFVCLFHFSLKVHPCCCQRWVSLFFFLFLVKNIPFCVNLAHALNPFIRWWTIGLFHVLASVNNATINMGVQRALWNSCFLSFRCVPSSGIALLSLIVVKYQGGRDEAEKGMWGWWFSYVPCRSADLVPGLECLEVTGCDLGSQQVYSPSFDRLALMPINMGGPSG